MTKRKKSTVSSRPASKSTYTATLSIYGKDYQGVGDSVISAIEDIKIVHPPRARGILTVAHANQARARIIPPFAVSRLFAAPPLMRQVQLKNVSLLFDV